MSDVAIRAENLSKQYRIGTRERYRTLRETLTDAVSAPFRYLRKTRPGSKGTEPPSEMIWALKDLSFEVPRGAIVGVIGKNGAGKSTLLKVLSRITDPTEGHVEIRGRVGSLLEVEQVSQRIERARQHFSQRRDSWDASGGNCA